MVDKKDHENKCPLSIPNCQLSLFPGFFLSYMYWAQKQGLWVNKLFSFYCVSHQDVNWSSKIPASLLSGKKNFGMGNTLSYTPE